MAHPNLLIDQEKFLHNAHKLIRYFQNKKVFWHLDCSAFGQQETLPALLREAGIRQLASVHLEDFLSLQNYTRSGLLLRPPLRSQVSAVVSLCQVSVQCDWDLICALADAAMVQQKRHQIILQLESGDRGVGVNWSEAEAMIDRILQLKGVELVGLREDFTRMAGVLPTPDKLQALTDFASYIEDRYKLELPLVSGGSSSSLSLLEEGPWPKKVNHLTVGESFLTGKETAFDRSFAGLHQDCFHLRAEIFSLDRKPALADGELSPLFKAPDYGDEGNLLRAVLAFGEQDVKAADLIPRLKGVHYLYSSRDQTIYDVTRLNRDLKVGDALEFIPDYPNLLRLFLSPYVAKQLV